MKKVISSLFIGALVAVVPARGALISQSSCHFLRERPEPVIETVEVNFDEIRGAEPEPAQMQTVQKAAVHYLTNLTPGEQSYINDPDIPDEVEAFAKQYGAEFNICPEFLEAIAFAESCYMSKVSNGSCVGLMQINLDCSDKQQRMDALGYTDADMWEPGPSMHVAADYLAYLFEEYEDDAEVLMRYNGDQTGLKRYHQSGEVSKYTKKILDLSEELEKKHGK